ncbi:hypothetical protein IU448_10845 [Nocardia flavorosea]|uniref:hypothetical protein n=1 Tax=Nocardia flavorosea TaxID=53429 RepID=UPI001894150A|nr:hypothetical protein [Nocardia flavorosea]MBF6349517.1 hypothetical protein [Nocardia flavorosea]
MSDADELGPFPSSRVVSAVFTRAAEFDRSAAAEFDCAMLESLAGLVVAHRRMAAARPAWDDIVLPWEEATTLPGRPENRSGADPFDCACDEVQRRMLSIDLEARRILGPPSPDSVSHHEGLGAVFGRMAHLYTISFDRFILDGPEGLNRRQLVREYAAYEALARDLVAGRKCLPALSQRPAF